MIEHFIIGGAYQGKSDFAKRLCPEGTVLDCKADSLENLSQYKIILNLEEAVRILLRQGKDPVSLLPALLDGKIVTGREVGCGVVPISAEERLFRDEAGRTYQALSQNAKRVTRMFCGISQSLKE